MNSRLKIIIDEFEDVMHEVQTFAFAARAIELQEEALQKGRTFVQKLVACKEEFIRDEYEEGANLALASEIASEAVLKELEMWILLKRDEGEAAWGCLVDAQSCAEMAVATRRQILGQESTKNLANYYNRLLQIEYIMFPPQTFCSAGGIAKQQLCSICKNNYRDCDHIRGRIYLGAICRTVISEIELEEVSIVEDPANKHCRIITIDDGGVKRNKMTWRIESGE